MRLQYIRKPLVAAAVATTFVLLTGAPRASAQTGGLSTQTYESKDAEIAALQAQVDSMTKQIDMLTFTIARLRQQASLIEAPAPGAFPANSHPDLDPKLKTALMNAFQAHVSSVGSLDSVVGSGRNFWHVHAGQTTLTETRISIKNSSVLIGRVFAVQQVQESAHFITEAAAQKAPCIRTSNVKAVFVFVGLGSQFTFDSVEFPS